jgi:hypothetical protein
MRYEKRIHPARFIRLAGVPRAPFAVAEISPAAAGAAGRGYTEQISGVNATVGEARVEIYEVP